VQPPRHEHRLAPGSRPTGTCHRWRARPR